MHIALRFNLPMKAILIQNRVKPRFDINFIAKVSSQTLSLVTLKSVLLFFFFFKVFLPDREYSLALDCLTKACSDILVEGPKGDILLGCRKVEPQPHWWFIGGRSRPGETPKEGARR